MSPDGHLFPNPQLSYKYYMYTSQYNILRATGRFVHKEILQWTHSVYCP
jgi:hypothetical protein